MESIKETVMEWVDWVTARLKERTSWDGAVIIAGCLVIILTGGLAKALAWIGLAYGAWTCYMEEK